MKTIYFAATSLDGYIADKNNSLEWLFQFGEPKGDPIGKFMSSIGVIAMGSTTYMWLYDHMMAEPKEKQVWPYQMPAFVFTSRKLPAFPGADIRFVQGDVTPVHQQMKTLTDKNIWIVGGGELAGKFYDAGLLDELQIQIASVTLGAGAPLFPRELKRPLKLKNVNRLDQEFVELTYET